MIRLFLSFRYLLLVASVGSVVGATIMFALGAAKLIHAARMFFTGPLEPRATTTDVMGATDAFLFGIVLIIFALTIAFGFVFDHSEGVRERLPRWMRVGSLRDLKYTLIEVIVVYLVVDAATDFAETEHLAWQALIKPATILAIAAALRLMGTPEPANRG
jgi:uncharacterized membrane protein YqhA